jgi:gustatory receptor
MPMVLQIYLPCYFGNHVLVASQKFSMAIFHLRWYEQSKAFNSDMRIVVENAKKPIVIICGKVFKVTLETFVSICQVTYQFYALLQSKK